MASPKVDLRLPERLHARVLEAAEAEGLSLSGFVRRAILDRLSDATREAAERAALLAEARSFLAAPGSDREAASLVSRYVAAIEAQSGGAGAGRHARRRGFLRAALAAERARALLAALPEPSPAPSAAGLLGEARTRKLWTEAVSWPGWRRVFCGQHGIVPSAPSSDGTRCYLGCTIPTSPEAA